MSVTEQTTTGIPSGAWAVDSIHSSIGFAVKHSGVMTFRGGFDQFDAKLQDGRLEGLAKDSSIPGVLKNALDWASRPLADCPLRNKPAAVLSSSTGMFGGVWAAAETRKVLGALGARTLENTVSVSKADQRLAEGIDERLRNELRTVVGALATAVAARTAALAA